jgi:hypothetical protein
MKDHGGDLVAFLAWESLRLAKGSHLANELNSIRVAMTNDVVT